MKRAGDRRIGKGGTEEGRAHRSTDRMRISRQNLRGSSRKRAGRSREKWRGIETTETEGGRDTLRMTQKPGMLVHPCNPNYSGGRGKSI
jgi:hypothetical protein